LSETENKQTSAFGKYKVECVIMKDGIDEHLFRRVNKFPYTVKHGDKKYEITTDALFEIETTTLKKIQNLAFLIRREYMIIFREGETQPLIRFDSAISPRVLKVARTSSAVKGMIKEWFSGGKFPMNKWLFIIIVASIGTFVYAKMTGMI
jgi:hypothetical protein